MASSSHAARGDRALLESLWREPVERQVLPNGLTVILKRDGAAPVVSVQVWVRTGSIHEGAQLGAGLSHFLEHMLFKGTERRAGRDLSSTVQAHGGYVNAYTTFDRTVYYIDIPAEHAAVAVDVLADATLRSTLPAEEVAKEKDVILREIDMCLDDPDQRLGQALFETAFRVHPYRQPIIGHRDVFAATTRDDLLAYYRERYAPNNLVVVAVGDFDPAAMRATVAEHFGGAPRRRLAPVLVPDEPPQLARRERHLFEDVTVARAGLGWRIPALSHPDMPALDLLAMVLGHGDSSLLWRALRDRARLVHTIDAMTWSPGSTGLFYVSFLADAEKRALAEEAVQRELARVAARGLPAAALRKAVRQAVAAEVSGRKTMAGQAARLGTAEVVIGDPDYARRYFERLFALRPVDLRDVLRRYLVPEALTIVTSNPAATAAVASAPVARSRSATAFEEVALPNGARLLLQPERGLPNLHFRLALPGGPLFEPPDRRGANALLASLLTKDTSRRSAERVAAAIEAVGGTFGEFCGHNSFGLQVEVLPGDAPLALELLGDAVLRPVFRPERLGIEREAALAALREADDDVVTFGRRRLRALFFGAHPFAVESGGDESGLRAVGSADLQALHRRLVVAGPAVLAVAGDFEPRRLRPRLEALLAGLPAGRPTPAPATLAPVARDQVEVRPRQQAVVFHAFPGPGLLEPDHFVAEVADELFSGMSSHLFERVREQLGLAYFVRSARVTGLAHGMFYLFAGTSPAHYPRVLEEFEREVARVQDGAVGTDELRRCQVRLKAARRMARQTNAARALHAALNAVYGLPVDDDARYDAAVEAVTVDSLADFARRRLRPDRRTQLVVKP